MFFQKSPSLCAPCNALNRNCCIGRCMSFLLDSFQIVSSVSRFFDISCIVYLAISRFLFVVFHCFIWALFLRFWYANVCVIFESFAPCTSNSIGIFRSIWSYVSFSAPLLAKESAASFPSFPECPFIHSKVVCADLFLS